MRRASVNYWVDAVTAAAFVVCAGSGMLFLLPSGWWTAGGVLGLSAAAWHPLHDWSGVVLTAGVAGHLVLHWRWILKMTQREFSDGPAARRSGTGPVDPLPWSTVATADPVVAASRGDDRAPRAPMGRGPGRQRLYDRRDFLGAALAAGAVAVAGAGLLARGTAASSSGVAQTADAQSGSGWSGDTGSGSGQSGTTQDPYGQSSTGTGSTQGESGGTTTTVSRVSVDSGRCVGCGHCLQTCPYGVFDWSSDGRTAAAARPGDCRLCGRCLQVCVPQAITLNA